MKWNIAGLFWGVMYENCLVGYNRAGIITAELEGIQYGKDKGGTGTGRAQTTGAFVERSLGGAYG